MEWVGVNTNKATYVCTYVACANTPAGIVQLTMHSHTERCWVTCVCKPHGEVLSHLCVQATCAHMLQTVWVSAGGVHCTCVCLERSEFTRASRVCT